VLLPVIGVLGDGRTYEDSWACAPWPLEARHDCGTPFPSNWSSWATPPRTSSMRSKASSGSGCAWGRSVALATSLPSSDFG